MFVLHASHKYMVSLLTHKCTQFLQQHLTPQTAAQLLQQTIFFREDELKHKILSMISEETSEVLQSEGFLTLSHDALKQILSLDTISTTEVELFSSAIAWAKKRCHGQVTQSSIRETLGDCFHLIRFPTMSIDDFNDRVLTEDILTDSEGFTLYKYITAKQSKPSCGLFNATPRGHFFKTQTLIFNGPYGDKKNTVATSTPTDPGYSGGSILGPSRTSGFGFQSTATSGTFSFGSLTTATPSVFWISSSFKPLIWVFRDFRLICVCNHYFNPCIWVKRKFRLLVRSYINFRHLF